MVANHNERMNGANKLNWKEFTPNDIGRLEEIVANVWQCRSDFFNRFLDPRTNIDAECGYPDSVLSELYRSLYDRGAIAERVVQLLPKECFQVTPNVYEDESAENATEFEKAWDELGKSLHPTKSWYQDEEGSLLWSYLCKADILSGIGTFGVMLIGVNDGKLLQEPIDGVVEDSQAKDITGVSELQTKDIYGGDLPSFRKVQDANPLSQQLGTDAQYFQTVFSPQRSTGKKKTGKGKGGVSSKPELTFLRVFDESLVQVVQYESSNTSPRFGMPVMYDITLNDPRQPHSGVGLPLATVRVHWSRVIHLAESGDQSAEVFAKPRMRPVLNNILDLRKLYGGSAEMYWKGAFMGLSFETHPQLGGDVVLDVNNLKTMLQDYQANLTRGLMTTGMAVKTLSPQVVDPSSQINVQIEAICIELGCPVRVFKGSERGELASSQDDSSWNDRIQHRQKVYISPRIIAPFIDRLILIGILPEPEGYSIEWPDLDSTTKKDKAAIALQYTQAIVAYVGPAATPDTVIPPKDFLTRIMGLDEEEAESILDDVEKLQEQKQADAEALAEDHGMIPTPPPGFQHPEPPPIPPAGMKGGPPANPVAVKPGDKLVHPQTGSTVAQGNPQPKPKAPTK